MIAIKKDQNGVYFITATIVWTWGILAVPAFLKLGFGDSLTCGMLYTYYRRRIVA